jgi:hypothetical protein
MMRFRSFPFEGGNLTLANRRISRDIRDGKVNIMPLDYYDIHMNPGAKLTLDVKPENTLSWSSPWWAMS